jgi:hypothetical protein
LHEWELDRPRWDVEWVRHESDPRTRPRAGAPGPHPSSPGPRSDHWGVAP